MKLPEPEVELFYKLHPALLFYANQRLSIAPDMTTLPQLLAMPEVKRYEIRSALYEHIEVIDSFVRENPQGFSPDELAIVESWKHFVQGQFYVFRHLKRYTVFLDPEPPPKAYGVLGLHDDLEDLFPRVPMLIEAVLLPFKNQLIYDGQCRYYNVFFGGGIKRRLNDSYQLAKAHPGVITAMSLEVSEAEPSDEEQLRFYLRSERNREMYWDEIEMLVQKSRSLETCYHQEMGKIHARTYSKRLRGIGLSGVWFAILEGLTIASGKSRSEVEQAVKRIVPKDKLSFVHSFQVKASEKRRRASASGAG